MALTNKTRKRSRRANWTITRKIYDNSGKLFADTSIPVNVGSGIHPYSAYCYSKHRSDYMSYYSDSNWRTVLATQGWLPTRGLTRLILTVEGDQYSNTYRHPFRWYERVEIQGGTLNAPSNTQSFEDPGSVVTPLRTSLELDAQYKCLSRARDLRVNAPVALLEMGKTVQMLKETAQTLAQAYHAFRKGRFKKAARALGIDTPTKTAANHWLAYQYGWRPLLSDAVGAATVLYDFFEGPPPKQRVTAKAIADLKTKEDVNFGAHPWVSGYTQLLSWTRTAVAKAGLLLELKYTQAALSSQLGVGRADPLLTAWEVVPFSFVFDWFVGVGEWLEARSSLDGYSVLTGWASSDIRYQWSLTEKPGGTYTRPDSKVTWKGTYQDFWRKGWTGSVVQLRMPLFDGVRGNRLTTAAALARQLLIGDRLGGNYRP